MPFANRQIVEAVETRRYTMTELYELRRTILRHARAMPIGVRNEHRQIARSMRSLSRDKRWLAIHTVDGIE